LKIMQRVRNGAFTSFVINKEIAEFSGQDKSFITDVCYGSLRNYIFLEACLKPSLKRPDKLPADVINALIAASYEILIKETPRRAAVNEWVTVVKKKYGRLAGLVNAVLRKLEKAELEPGQLYSIPNWLFNDWQTLFGQETAIKIAQGMLEPEPLWLYQYNKNAKNELLAESCTVNPGPLENTLAIRPSKPLNKLKAFKSGGIQAQNPCSTIPVRALDLKSNERVLDLASGNGIKAAQVAAMGAKPVCIELDPKKLERSKNNLKRLGFQAEHISFDLRNTPEISAADKVLLDAPCSGTGTLRGNPEIKLRLTKTNLEELADLQKAMLKTAAQLTNVGGTLVYSVCALSTKESTEQINSFLKDNQEFGLEPIQTTLPHHDTEFGTFLLPYNGLDGFFIAKLIKHK